MEQLGRESDAALMRVKAPGSPARHKERMHDAPLLDPDRTGVLSLPAETRFAGQGIVSRTLLRTPTTRVVLFGFAAGQELSEHTSTAGALIQILSGRCEFSVDGQPHALQAGDLLHMPPNVPHAVSAIEQFSMLLTLIQPAERAPQPPLAKPMTIPRA